MTMMMSDDNGDDDGDSGDDVDGGGDGGDGDTHDFLSSPCPAFLAIYFSQQP